jgi:hypothetical protein
MPEMLRKRLASEAEQNQRSLNSEILWRLGQTLEKEWQDFIAGKEQAEKDEQELIEKMTQTPEFRESIARILAKMKKEGRSR